MHLWVFKLLKIRSNDSTDSEDRRCAETDYYCDGCGARLAHRPYNGEVEVVNTLISQEASHSFRALYSMHYGPTPPGTPPAVRV